ELIGPLLGESERFPAVQWWIGMDDAPLVLSKLTAEVGDVRSGPNVALNPSSMCNIRYTAGTTGRPKGALFTHGGRISGINIYLAEEKWTERDPSGGLGTPRGTLVVSPLTHAGASY